MTNASASSQPEREGGGERQAVVAILVVSALALGFLVWLIYFNRGGFEDYRDAVAAFPALNAALNGLSACCLVSGYAAIRRGRRRTHMTLMLTAFVFSTLFLVSYIVYHAVHGDTRFLGTGWIRPVYFFVLISHIGLSIVTLPLVLTTFYLALTKRFMRHKKLAKITLPLWLYISVTGVAIFFLLRAHS